PRVGEEALALFGRRRLLAVPMQQWVAERVLEPLDLLAHRRLRAMHALAGAGEAAGVDHRHKAAEKLQIEHGSRPFTFQLILIISFNFQISRGGPTSGAEGVFPMRPTSIAASAPPTASNPTEFRIPFPLMVTGFCLLWASAFSVAKVAMADCPPLT